MSRRTGNLPRSTRGSNGRFKVPTRKHRAAIWENMLGTVYAMNPKGKVKYFDYDYAGAVAWAEITAASDVRRGRYTWGVGGGPSPSESAPRPNQNIWWVAP